MEIKLEDLMNLTIGQIASMTASYLKQNPGIKTAQELLDELDNGDN
jgi:hypothetical protein